MLQRITAAAICALVLAVPACRRTPASSQPAADHVTVAIGPFISHAPVFIAQDEGFFKEQRLDVEFVNLRRSPDGIPALAQGKLDVLSGAVNAGILNVIARGSDLRIVADKGHWPTSGPPNTAILVRKAVMAQGAVNDPAKLRTLRFQTNKDNMQALFCDRAMRRHGVRLDEMDVLFVPDAALPDAFRNGSLDLVSTSEPWVTRLMETGAVDMWIKDSDVIPGLQFTYLAYGPSLLRDRPEVGRRFMTAYLKGVRQYQQGKTERNVAVLAAHTELEPEFLKRVFWLPFAPDGRINVESVMEFQTWAKEQGLIDRVLKPEEFWDPSFADAANAALGPATGPATH